jgi:hypothetical protein
MAWGKIWKKILIAVLAVVLCTVLGSAALAYFGIYRPNIRFEAIVSHAREKIAKHEREFFAGEERLAKAPLFGPRTGTRDASPLIGPRIHWVMVKQGVIDHRALSSLAIDRSLHDRIGKNHLNAPKVLWKDLDFGWMRELKDKDYWDLESNSIFDPSSYIGPAPALEDLYAWAELRLAKGMAEGDLAKAEDEVLDLARLCFTAESLSPEVYGTLLLSIVNQARKGEGAPTVADCDEIRGAIFGALAFARLETPREYWGRIDHLTVGRCTAIADGARAALLLRPMLAPSRPEEYREMERILERNPDCRLRSIREGFRWADDQVVQGESAWERVLWKHSLLYRRVIAQILLGIGGQDWFRSYDEAPEPAGQR